MKKFKQIIYLVIFLIIIFNIFGIIAKNVIVIFYLKKKYSYNIKHNAYFYVIF